MIDDEIFLIFIVAVLLFVFVCFAAIYSFFKVNNLGRKVAQQSKQIAALSAHVKRLSAPGKDSGKDSAPVTAPPAVETPTVPEPTPAAAPSAPVAQDTAPVGPVVKSAPLQPPTSETPPPKTPAQEAPTSEPPAPQQAMFFSGDNVVDLAKWLRDNWFYAVSAVSLALAGIFLAQYLMERGLLPPTARILGALAFGAALIVVGEWIRRRYGDTEDTATAYLPSVFSGAGLVTLFAALMSARLLYNLIGPEVAWMGMVLVSLLAIVLGWFYGPLLAAIGLLGATMAPSILDSSSGTAYRLYPYFMTITIVGLAIDSVRRWAWVSVLALVLGFGASWLLHMSGTDAPYLAITATLMLIAAVTIPVLQLRPTHDGPMAVSLLKPQVSAWPYYSTRLVIGTTIATTGTLVWIATADAATFWLVIAALTLLVAFFALWLDKAPALADMTVIPAIGFLIVIFLEREFFGYGLQAFRASLDLPPESPIAKEATWLLIAGILMSAAAAVRALQNTWHATSWTAGAALLAPLTFAALDLSFAPAAIIGSYPWALHAAAIAIAMMFFAERLARQDGPDAKMRAGLALLACLSMISYAFAVIFSLAALTAAWAVTLAAAALLDRRFNVPPVGWFVQAVAIFLGYRLVIDPGIFWAYEAHILEVLLSYGSVLAALIFAYIILLPMRRRTTKIVVESAAWYAGAIFVNVLLYRYLTDLDDTEGAVWTFSLHAMTWTALAFAQFYRMRAGSFAKYVRIVLGLLYLATSLLLLLFAITIANPLFDMIRQDIVGPVFFNTLAIAYLLPGLLFLAGAKVLDNLNLWVRWTLGSIGVALIVLYVGLAIRHFWQGPDLSLPGVTQPELYSYTVALLLTGSVLLYQAIAKQSSVLRRLAMGVIGLSVVKVFFVDITGLEGLTRVFSLLALGLCLAGLAWLNRWAARAAEEDGTPEEPESDQSE